MSKLSVTLDGRVYDIEVKTPLVADSLVVVNGETLPTTVPGLVESDALGWIIVDNRVHEVVVDHDLRWIQSSHGRLPLEVHDLEAATARPVSGDARVKAPVPGLIVRVFARQGEEVQAGQPLLILEAMKMENEIAAPRSGILTRLDVAPGQSVTLHQMLAEIT